MHIIIFFIFIFLRHTGQEMEKPRLGRNLSPHWSASNPTDMPHSLWNYGEEKETFIIINYYY